MIVRERFADAERRLFAYYGLDCDSRLLRLADPAVSIGVRECGAGEPVVFIHGSGMSGATWSPVIAYLHDSKSIVIDLPGFGLSDAYSYAGRSLRAHANAQLTSVLDAMGLNRVALVGTSLGGMWALCLAVDAPKRVRAVVSIGMPAVALPGVRGDPFFTLLTIPGLGRIASRVMPAPKSAKAVRRAMKGVIGQPALDRTPEEFFDVVSAGMRMPGWREAMWTHLNLALRFGRGRRENNLRDDELQSITTPVQFIWGEDDVYGGPAIGRRAADLIPQGRLDVMPGNHAPFLDDPARCAALITDAIARAGSREQAGP
jgi:pimeloyl-ACP methyl ester carboxylesterase